MDIDQRLFYPLFWGKPDNQATVKRAYAEAFCKNIRFKGVAPGTKPNFGRDPVKNSISTSVRLF
jgi:hypothetical protein